MNITDIYIFESLLTIPYLTAEQVCELHYSAGSYNYVRDKLKQLTQERYLYRLERPTPNHPYLYTLAHRARLLLRKEGYELLNAYPTEKKSIHAMHYPHTLLTNEVMIAALKLKIPDTTWVDIRHDFFIRGLMKGVRPDCFFHFQKGSEHIPLWVPAKIPGKGVEGKQGTRSSLQAVWLEQAGISLHWQRYLRTHLLSLF